MHKTTLREIAKFASGLIMGDFIWGIWLYAGGYLPITFLGIVFGKQTTIGWLVFDVLLFALLVHYAWGTASRPRNAQERKFHFIIGIIFTLVALAHSSRILFNWNLVIGSWTVPFWLNGLGTIVALFLAYASFHLAKKE